MDAPPGGAAAAAATSSRGQVKDLAQQLAVAAQVLEEHSGEGRDVVSEGQKREEKSATSLCSSGNLSDLKRSGSGSGSGCASASGSAHSDSGQALQDGHQMMADKGGRDVSEPEHMLEVAQSKDARCRDKYTNLVPQMEGVETSHAAQVRYLEEQLKVSRMKQLQFDHERNDLEDKIAGLEARQEFNSARFEMDREADRDDLNGDAFGTGFTYKAELEGMKRSEQAMRRSHENQVGNLQRLLDCAIAELAYMETATAEGPSAGPEIARLQNLLAASRESVRKMNAELGELRVEVLSRDQAQSQSKSAGGDGSRGSGSARREKLGHSSVKPQPATLMGIEEEDDELGSNSGSAAASGNVSSGMSDEAADQEDLKDQDTHGRAQTELRPQQSREERRSHHVSKAETAENDARLHVKPLRLQQSAASREGAAERFSEHGSVDEPARRAVELEMALAHAEQQLSDRQRERETERKIAMDLETQHRMELQDLRDQYYHAVEAKKIAERRLEDFKREMAALEGRHAAVMGDLAEQLRVAGSEKDTESTRSTEHTGSSRASEKEMKKQREKSWEEERGVLINKLEWKEVQWKGQMDDIELQHAAEVAQIKKQYEEEVKQLRAEFQERADQQKDASAGKSSSKSTNGRPAEQQSLLAMLRCPMRLLDASGMQSSGAGEAAYCQEVCWKVVTSMPGIVAILCGTSDLQIIEASKKACMVWGSSQLFGQSLLSLLPHESGAAWLKRACETHQKLADVEQRGVPGFLMRELGCLEFQSKAGNTCDLSVLMVHLPEEPRTGKQKAVLAILQPMEDSSGGRDRYADDNNFAERCRRRRSGQSGYSDVSEDVTPSDSVSHVMG